MDRASYEAGFRAAQEQNLQQPPEQGNQFLDAVGKTALGLGVAAGSVIAGNRLMRGRGDQVRQNAEQVAKYVMARDPQKSGVNVRDLSKIDPDAVRRAAAYGKTPEVQYEAPGRIDSQDFASPEVREARRQQATQDLLAAQQARKGAYQLEIPGVKGDLMVIRSKEGFDPQTMGEVTPSAPSRPLSAAPDQLSIDFNKKYLSDKGYIDPGTSTEAQVVRRSSVVEQSNEAIDTAADQEAMRVSRTVQRDPGENLAEFEQLQDRLEQRGASPVEAADTAVAITEGNEAFTQTDRPLNESSAARFLANERDEIASQLAEQGKLITPGRIEKELANRFGSEAYKYGPEYTQLKQNIQLGATYDPELFDNPSKPFVQIAGEEVPTGRVPATKLERTPYTNELIAEDVELGLRQPTYMEETAGRLREQAEKKRDWLGSVRLEEASKNAKLNAELINTNRQYNETLDYSKELTDFLDSKQGTPEQRTRARQRLDDVNYELDRLDVLSEDLNQRVYGGQSGARVRGAEKFTEDYIAGLTPPSRLKPGVEEGQRVFFEADEFGQPIPGTQEFRSERKMVDADPKGGGGRNVAEFTAGERLDEEIRAIQSGGRYRDYDETGAAVSRWQDPRTSSTKDGPGVGSTTDIYGVRPDLERQADPERRPSEPRYTKTEIADEAMRLSSASPEGDVPVAPDYEAAIESLDSQPKTEASRRSVLMSEAIRKAAREKANRNPRGGKIPGELGTLRRSMPEITASDYLGQGPRSRVAGLPPQQRTIPGVTGYDARQRRSQADIAAQQLESYMKRRMTGRSTPLTSEVVIQPKLF
jgi:hypothetical protein